MTSLRRCAPFVVTAFVNKCGNIGLALVPMILVDQGVAAGVAATVIGVGKSAQIAGLWLGGWATDRVRARTVILAALLVGAAGMAALPVAASLPLLAAAAFAANLGTSLVASPMRLLIAEALPAGEQRVGLGWLRTANNGGTLVAFGLGALGLSLTALIALDAASSLVAAAIGLVLLPAGAAPGSGRHATTPRPRPSRLFVLCTLLIAGYGFLYEAYMTGIAGRCRVMLGADGLAVFSEAMMVNTLLCAVFAVFASRWLDRAAVSFPVGLGLTAAGAMLSVAIPGRPGIYVGAFTLTAGEILFTVMGQYILVRLAPVRGRGSLVGFAMLLSGLGRVAGGSVAFPLVVEGAHPVAFFGIVGGLLAALSLLAHGDLVGFDRSERNLQTTPAAA